jgi:hypothetical protein
MNSDGPIHAPVFGAGVLEPLFAIWSILAEAVRDFTRWRLQG